MQKIGITAIVNMRETPIPSYKGMEHIRTLHLPTIDLTAPSLSDLKKGIKFIKKEIEREGKVYIHCRLGEGRGPSMMIAYLMSTGLTLEDSLKLIKEARPFIQPTKLQLEQLKVLEQQFI